MNGFHMEDDGEVMPDNRGSLVSTVVGKDGRIAGLGYTTRRDPADDERTPIDELVRRYESEGCDFGDMEWVREASLRCAKTMPDSQVRCLLHALASAPPAAAVPPERDWTMIQSGDASIPAWVVHYANAIGAYMKVQSVKHWAVGPVQSRNDAQQPAALADEVTDEYASAFHDGWLACKRGDAEPPAPAQQPAAAAVPRFTDIEAAARYGWEHANWEWENVRIGLGERNQHPAAAVPDVPTFTTGHCDYHKQAGGCPLHNLSCGWPKCDQRPSEAHRAMLAAANKENTNG